MRDYRFKSCWKQKSREVGTDTLTRYYAARVGDQCYTFPPRGGGEFSKRGYKRRGKLTFTDDPDVIARRKSLPTHNIYQIRVTPENMRRAEKCLDNIKPKVGGTLPAWRERRAKARIAQSMQPIHDTMRLLRSLQK